LKQTRTIYNFFIFSSVKNFSIITES